jgi:Lon protease-like protein
VLLFGCAFQVNIRGYNKNTGGVLSKLLPLFPLDIVLLPGAPLPLHVFEPRYKEMIAECLAGDKLFGIVRSQEEGVADIGCTAEILDVTKKYEDGRMDITTAGRRRFEVMEVNQERSFLQAEVMFIEDEPGSATKQEIDTAVELHKQLMEIAGVEEEEGYSDIAQLSYYLAGSLPLDLDFKQNLLTMKSEAERMPVVVSYFQTILPALRRTAMARKLAGGNGHVH